MADDDVRSSGTRQSRRRDSELAQHFAGGFEVGLEAQGFAIMRDGLRPAGGLTDEHGREIEMRVGSFGGKFHRRGEFLHGVRFPARQAGEERSEVEARLDQPGAPAQGLLVMPNPFEISPGIARRASSTESVSCPGIDQTPHSFVSIPTSTPSAVTEEGS